MWRHTEPQVFGVRDVKNKLKLLLVCAHRREIMCMVDWKREHYISKAQSKMKAWRSTSKKESDGRKIKRGRWAVKELHARAGEVSSFLPIISCFLADHNSIYTFTISHGVTLPPLPTFPWCGDWVPVHLHLTHMACTSTPLWVRVCLARTRTHPRTQMHSQGGGLCSNLVRWHGTWQACNVQCHDNGGTPQITPPMSLLPLRLVRNDCLPVHNS